MIPPKKELALLPAGKELDQLVAQAVMGWTPPRIGIFDSTPPLPVLDGKWDYLNPPQAVEDWRSNYHWREAGGACWTSVPKFSTDMGAAWKVWDELARKGYVLHTQINSDGVRIASVFGLSNWGSTSGWVKGTSMPHVICIAALLAIQANT